MKRIYLVAVAAQGGPTGMSVWATTITITGSLGRGTSNAIIEESYKHLPPRNGYHNHQLASLLDISEESRDFARNG